MKLLLVTQKPRIRVLFFSVLILLQFVLLLRVLVEGLALAEVVVAAMVRDLQARIFLEGYDAR